MTTPEAERRAQLYLRHPAACPDGIGPLDYLIHPPSEVGSTAAWVRFRDLTLIPMNRARPDDPNLPLFLARANEILAWREAIPPEDRFWRSDKVPPASGGRDAS